MIKQTPLQIFLRFLRFGFLAWGGPVAQIAMIRKELVDEEKWIPKEKFNRVLAVYQVLPGPEATELAVYFGMLAGSRWKGFLAGFAFVLPGFIFMLLLTWFYVAIGINSPLLQAAFTGFQAAVIALIFRAVHRIGEHALVNKPLFIIAGISAIAHFFGIHFLIVLPLAGASYVFWMRKNYWFPAIAGIGLLIACGFNFSPELFQKEQITDTTSQHSTIIKSDSQTAVFLTGLKAGLLTFGGAYTVIPFVQEDAVKNHKWMTNEQFLDGIALSGIAPAPLIIFSTFVGYFGGGWLGAIIITIAIFLPAFCFTLIGHEILEKITENTALHNFLDGITAGVIGLIAVTAIQLFRITINDLITLIIFAVSLFVLYRVKSRLLPVYVILGAGLISLIYYQLM